jgi:tetratricopeptide (TPR) repeat protein
VSPVGLAAAWLLGLVPAAELSAAAASSARPPACRVHGAELGSTLWTRARLPEVVRSCRSLSRAHARLGAHPAEALALAEAAEAAPVNAARARLLRGRALFRLGRVAEAWVVLAPFLEPAAAPLDDAQALFDIARSALSAGVLDAAARAYRLLVPRSALLGSRQTERIVLIEAASLALARGPADIDEALGYLDTARAIPLAGERDLVLGLTALALERSGRTEQARAAAREADGPWDLEAEMTPAERARVAEAAFAPGDTTSSPARIGPSRVMLLDGELHAAIAVLAAGRDEALRRAHWRAFLASAAGQGPWAEQARRALQKR